MFDGGDDGDQDDALRSALRHAVGTICDAGKGRHGLDADPEFVSTLAYVVEKYAKRLATDLPAFAKHGKRSVAGAEDVLLVARDNPDLLRRLTEFVDSTTTAARRPRGRRRRMTATRRTTCRGCGKERVCVTYYSRVDGV